MEKTLLKEQIAINSEAKQKIRALCMIIVIVSFLGFCTENIWCAITHGFMDNRNMRLPFLLGYGLAMVAIYLMFGTPKSPRFFAFDLKYESRMKNLLVYFCIAFLCVSLGEIILGTFVENTCNLVWWDYTELPMNITKYTSVPTSAAFGALITVFMNFFFVPIYNFFMKSESKTVAVITYSLMFLLVADFLLSASHMYLTKGFVSVWRINF